MRIPQDIKGAAILDGNAFDDKLRGYKEQGLDKNALFIDTVYNLAISGKNAKYADYGGE